MITIFANIIFMKNNIFLNRVYYRCKIVSFYKYYTRQDSQKAILRIIKFL